MEGILPLYKPKGMTSHDCVHQLRKRLKIKKIGHTGTLDPEVDGVLPICIGRATRVAEYIQNAPKAYEGEVTLGFSTTTEDKTGEIVEQTKIKRSILKEEIEATLQKLTGEITQIPPMYSAVKVKGKKLYEYARKGMIVERPKRKVIIYSMELIDPKDEYVGETISFRFRVFCSKGTYIRTLAVMIGEMIGYPAHMSDLTRIQAGGYSLKDCITFAEVDQHLENGTFLQLLRPIETALSHLPNYKISDTLIEKVKNGAKLPIVNELEEADEIVVTSADGKALAIYIKHPTQEGWMKPAKVLRTNECL